MLLFLQFTKLKLDTSKPHSALQSVQLTQNIHSVFSQLPIEMNLSYVVDGQAVTQGR